MTDIVQVSHSEPIAIALREVEETLDRLNLATLELSKAEQRHADAKLAWQEAKARAEAMMAGEGD